MEYSHWKADARLTRELIEASGEMVEVRFPGTGDIFSGVLIGDVLDGRCLRDAAEHAMTVVRRIILDNLQKPDKFAGVDVERFISEGKL